MRKIVLSLTTGMVAACALTVLMAAHADEKMAMEDFSDLELEFTEDASESDLDLSLPAPEAPQTAEKQVPPAPAKELNLAQTPAPAAPAAPEAGAVDANVSNILAEPALNPPAANVPATVPSPAAAAAPIEPADAPIKTVEPTIPKLPPVEKSIVKTPGVGEPLPPAVTIDPTVETVVPFDQPVTQPLAGNTMIARGPAPVMTGGGCPNCPQGGYGYGGPGANRPVYYGVQRNGLPAYPRAGNCCGCGGRGCPGCCGRRYPMEYPYYTLRGPRDFDDPNPRPIGP